MRMACVAPAVDSVQVKIPGVRIGRGKTARDQIVIVSVEFAQTQAEPPGSGFPGDVSWLDSDTHAPKPHAARAAQNEKGRSRFCAMRKVALSGDRPPLISSLGRPKFIRQVVLNASAARCKGCSLRL